MTVSGGSPYPGPRPYRWKEADWLCGRDKELADLRDLVTAYRVTLFYAQSGAGKTSLVAKLGPTLIKEGHAVFCCRVGVGNAASALGNVFVHSVLATLVFGEDELALTDDPMVSSRSDRSDNPLRDGLVAAFEAKGLVAARSPSANPRWELNRPCVLVVDQFEEIFTSHLEHWAQRQGFFEQLASTLDALVDVNVLLVIRDDYLAQLDRFASMLPHALRIRYRLERLRKPEAQRAVEQPLAAIGIDLSPEIAESIVGNLLKTRVAAPESDPPRDGPRRKTIEIEGEFVEPIHLQIACQNLWQVLERAPTAPAGGEVSARPGKALQFRRRGQTFLAGTDSIQGIDEALGASYEQALRAAVRTGVRESKLRRFIERHLITKEHTRGFVDRTTFANSGIPDRAVDTLVDARILRREPRSGAPWYELSHDRLLEPILNSNERARARRQLEYAAAGAVLALGLALSGPALFRSDLDTVIAQKDQAIARKEDQLDAWRKGLLATAATAQGGVRAPQGTSLELVRKETGGESTEMAAPMPNPTYEALLKQVKENLQAKQLDIERLQAELDRRDQEVAGLRDYRTGAGRRRPRLPRSGSSESGRDVDHKAASPSVPRAAVVPLLAKDIHPVVSAEPLASRKAIYRFSIALEIPRAHTVKEVEYSFDHPSFKQKTLTSSDAASGFQVGYKGWGCLTNLAGKIVPANGEPVRLTIDMCKVLGW